VKLCPELTRDVQAFKLLHGIDGVNLAILEKHKSFEDLPEGDPLVVELKKAQSRHRLELVRSRQDGGMLAVSAAANAVKSLDAVFIIYITFASLLFISSRSLTYLILLISYSLT
jgi:hypothetical protein